MDYFVDSPKWGLTAEEKADFFQGIFEADVSPVFGDGHFRMGFPPNRSMEVMYYNMDWLQELGYDGPPKTWAEFAEMACAATDAEAGTIGYEINTDASRFASMVFSRHGTYFEADGSAFDYTNDTVIETMTFIKDLYDQGCVTLVAESYGDQTDFGNYKTLFTIGSSSGLPYYDSAVKSGEQGEFVWSVAPLPYMDGGDEPVMNIYGASVSVPQTTPEQELAAWLFIKWYTAPEQNARWAKISNYFPVRASAAEAMSDYFDANPTFKEAFDLLQYGTYEAQWCACYEEVRRLMEDAYSAILDGADIEATMTQLQEDANVSLAENTPEGFEPGALTPTEPEPEVAAGPYEDVDPTGAQVLWWHQHTKERQEGLNQMVEEFNATNEWGIEVVSEYAGGYSEIYDKMIAAIAADDPTLLPNTSTPEPPVPTAEPTVALQAAPTETLPPGVTSIVFWEPLAPDRSQGLLLGEMVRDFEAENPDLLVEIVPKSGYAGIHGAMLAGLEGGDLPDLAVAFPSMIADYAAAGLVVPLDSYLYHAELGLGQEDLADLLPGLLDAGRLPGTGRQIMAFPFAQNAIGMWVNRTLLSQAGWDHVPASWDEFEQACFDVVAYTGVGCYPFVESASTLTAWIYSRGGQTLDPTGRQALFSEPPGVESLALLRRLIDAGLTSPLPTARRPLLSHPPATPCSTSRPTKRRSRTASHPLNGSRP